MPKDCKEPKDGLLPPMVLSLFSWNSPLTNRRTRLDLPTPAWPSNTNLNWKILLFILYDLWLYGLGGGIKSIDCRFLFSRFDCFALSFLSLRAGFTITLDQTITWSLGRASGDAVSSALFRLRFVASALSAANNEKPSFREILRLFFLALKRNSIFKSIYRLHPHLDALLRCLFLEEPAEGRGL